MKNWARIILWPLSLIYKVIIFFWDIYWRFSPKTKLPCKVISIGNIVAGGTGKTPLVIYIAKFAIASGYKTAVVARGYKRKGKGLVEVTTQSDWQEVGDEPLEIIRQVPQARIYVCNSKTLAAQKAFFDGAQIIIVDDGFQHRRLARDIDIVCLDSAQPFGPGGFLPYGLLREPQKALNRADAIVLASSANESSATKIDLLIKSIPTYRSFSRIKDFVDLKTGQVIKIENINTLKTIAFCGLANPDKFKDSLSKIGISPVEFIVYDDHHQYQNSDIEYLKTKMWQEKADCLLTTFKDAVKLESFDFSDIPVYFAQSDIEIDNEESFKQILGL
jgi:tetraacyldisaccharide 4'-kinase